MDYTMLFEKLTRKIFQCDRYGDPLGRLANTDSWVGINHGELSEEFRCKVWAVMARLQTEYLDSVPGREELYQKSEELNEQILAATSNLQLYEIMLKIVEIVEELSLDEFPHIDYSNTNDRQ